MKGEISTSGHLGICCTRFIPIKCGKTIRLRMDGLLFHQSCIEETPSSRFIAPERQRATRQKKKEIQCTTADQSRAH